MVKYKLLKELPDMKAGIIGESNKYGNYIFREIELLAKIASHTRHI